MTVGGFLVDYKKSMDSFYNARINKNRKEKGINYARRIKRNNGYIHKKIDKHSQF